MHEGHPRTFDDVIKQGFPLERLGSLASASSGRVRVHATVTAKVDSAVASGATATRVDANGTAFGVGEQDAFRNAVSYLVEQGTYAHLVASHVDMTHDMHGSMGLTGLYRFLPWHRRYLVEFERELQRADKQLRPQGTTPLAVPYWRWVDPLPSWLKDFLPARDPDTGAKPPARKASPPPPATPADIASILAASEGGSTGIPAETTYTRFTYALEGWARRADGTSLPAHNHAHAWVGGIMNNTRTSPTDPAFWLLHAEVDRLWEIWRLSHLQGPTLSGADRRMDPWPESVDDLADTAALGYAYGSLAP